MKESSRKIISDAVDRWLAGMIDSLEVNGTDAYYQGGTGTAYGGVGFDVTQEDALRYGEAYRKKLLEEGTISVTVPKFLSNGTVSFEVREYPWLKDKSATTKNGLIDIIERGIREGKPAGIRVGSDGKYPVGSIAEEINQYLGGEKTNAATIARTETARCYFNGEMDRYSKNGIEYVEYMGGPGACDICEPMIGKIFKVGSAPALPIHPNCRCDYRPYYPTPEELATLDVNPQISSGGDIVPGDILDDIDIELYEKPRKTVSEPVIKEQIPARTIYGVTGAVVHSQKGFPDRIVNNSLPLPEFKKPTITAQWLPEPTRDDIPEMVRQRTGISYNFSKEIRNAGATGSSITERTATMVKEHDEFLADKFLPSYIKPSEGDNIQMQSIMRILKGDYAETIYKNANVGSSISDYDYTSWTVNEALIKEHGGDSKYTIVLSEEVKSGKTPGYYLGNAAFYGDEQEIIRPRGLIYDIVRIEDLGWDGISSYVKILHVRTRGT